MRKIIAVLNIILLLLFCGCTKPNETAVSDDEVISGVNNDEAENAKGVLPILKYSMNDSNRVICDIALLSNGNFAVVGKTENENGIKSFIRIYNEKTEIVNEKIFEDGNSFEKIGVCSDGGFIVASYSPPTLTKLTADLKKDFVDPYENVEFEGTVQDVEEISKGLYAVLFVSANTPNFERYLKIAFLDDYGDVIDTVTLTKAKEGALDGNIIKDGKGGFYLTAVCNEELAKNHTIVGKEYNNSKATEAAVFKFNNKRELTWVKTLGGDGNDWCEESSIDKDGNIYLAVATDWYGADDFWYMSVDSALPYRRMLVKLNANGNIVFKAPLSNKGMATDQVFGIMTDDSDVYVVGMSDYFDGYQIKYPCEQISPEEKGDRVFSVYTARFTADGNELYRNIFRCDINNTPSGAVMLKGGTLVIAGSLDDSENPFNVPFQNGVHSIPSLFLYPKNK